MAGEGWLVSRIGHFQALLLVDALMIIGLVSVGIVAYRKRMRPTQLLRFGLPIMVLWIGTVGWMLAQSFGRIVAQVVIGSTAATIGAYVLERVTSDSWNRLDDERMK